MNSDTSGDNCNSRWVPLSYPVTAIFASSKCGGGVEQISANRRIANPFFPLHRDVLLATIRELMIIDGKIDHRTMEIIQMCGVDEGTHKIRGVDTKRTKMQKRKEISPTHVVPSSDEDERSNISHTYKKKRTTDSSAEYFATLQVKDEGQDSARHVYHTKQQTHKVPARLREDGVSFDYKQFKTAESMVECIVKYATSSFFVGEDKTNYQPARKVSDADNYMFCTTNDDESDFPSCIVSLVQTNIMLLQTSQEGSKLSKLASQSATAKIHPTTNAKKSGLDAMNSDSDNALLSFLRHPKLQRDQQQGKEHKTLFVLPRLLDVSTIDDECRLRYKAHCMVRSMMNSIPSNDLSMPMRVFLGYKSSKAPSRDRLLEILSDILFDVSHAMYAFLDTEQQMIKTIHMDKSVVVGSMDTQIKASLFDERALKRIGGFEPASLLPLALGIYRCRKAKSSWTEYATSEEGSIAMCVHDTKQQDVKGDASKAKYMTNNALLELGKKRRGRRGKSIIYTQL